MPCDHEALNLEKGKPRHQDKVNLLVLLDLQPRYIKELEI